MKRNIIYGSLCILLAVITSCMKDDLRNSGGEIGEGESCVSATVEFKPLSASTLGKTRSAGNAIKDIGSLCVLLYGTDGKLAGKYALSDYATTDEKREGSATEQTTKRATFKLTVPYGRYYIYAVANMGDLASYSDSIKTVAGLKNISFGWNSANIGANGQMFGHFGSSDAKSDEAPLLTINQKSMSLHAWIRRAASKVTVAYDGSLLEEGVFVYIKSVRIKDIPKSCLLGNKNTVTDKDSLITDGEAISYGTEGEAFDENWPACITKGRPYYPYDENTDSLSVYAHSQTAQALFFYENMQGEGENKAQDKNLEYKEKDNMPYGTYIEVQGYYRSINPERVGSGPIVYRFMLGKNTSTNYDAERNFHYKLTLKFNRFANDADWHIDYEEENPDIQVPNPYYISYLYNHGMMLPLKINSEGHELVSLQAVIDSNAWAPHNAIKNGLDYRQQMDPEVTPGAPVNPWNGFLSLRKTHLTVIPSTTTNEAYYNENNRGNRVYYKDGKLVDADNKDDGTFTMSRKGNTYVFNLPMYTRAKQMITTTGYTGNNPYVAYRRKAVVKFTAVLRNTSTNEMRTIEKNATIMQSRRIVNPKGIWRRHNGTSPFHVVLKVLPYESATSFQTLKSDGAWKAYVVRGDRHFIDLGADTVRGSTGSPIDFTVKFKGPCGEDESRFAIICVDYNNYSCRHLIFVRQGESPVALVENGRKWHACNMRTGTQETASPVDEGSMFKFRNWSQPIASTNNVNDKPLWINVSPGDFLDHSATLFKIAGTNDMKLWGEITSYDSWGSFSDPVINGKKVSVATYDDYKILQDTDEIEQAYGVLYGNDATETLSDIDEVYGYRYDPNGEYDSEGLGYGMRGTFVYNRSETPGYEGRSLFFPIGASGYGRRINSNGGKTAVLKYANTAQRIVDNNRPLFYDLYMRPGAAYWLKELGGPSSDIIGWDFNYFTFDFNNLAVSNLIHDIGSDACFVRCVED